MKFKVKIDENVQNELNRNSKILAWVLIGVGALLEIAYIAIPSTEDTSLLSMMLTVGAIWIGLGVALLISIKKAKQTALRAETIESYEFLPDFVLVATYQNGEIVSTTKLLYANICKTMETKSYFFFYPSKTSAYPIEKSAIAPEQLEQIKMWIDRARNAGQNLKNGNSDVAYSKMEPNQEVVSTVKDEKILDTENKDAKTNEHQGANVTDSAQATSKNASNESLQSDAKENFENDAQKGVENDAQKKRKKI